MVTGARRAVVGVLVAFVALSAVLVVSPTPAIADDPAATKLLLMLDASGSMNGKDASGLSKIKAAQKALTSVVNTLPAESQVGLRVYGATVQGGRPTPQACADTQLVHPIGPLDRPGLAAAINGFKAKGETPIAGSLKAAMGDLGAEGKRNIVLVSDGEESCVPDPCPVVKELVKQGIDLQIDTVGFAVDAKARKQLQCIAAAGNGSYYDAKDAGQLEESLNKLATRAIRPFAISGTPVKGVVLPDDAPLPSSVPVLTPGQYTDAIATSEDGWTFYTVQRTMPHSTVHIGFTARPRQYDDGQGFGWSSENWDAETRTADGIKCATSWALKNDGLGLQQLIGLGVVTLGSHDVDSLPKKDELACEVAMTLTLRVRRDKGGPDLTPLEISYIEEPPISNLATLPAPDKGVFGGQGKKVKASTMQPVTGGQSFSTATEISSGTWTDTLVPGEVTVYKIRLEPGQSVQFQMDGPNKGFTYPSAGIVLWVSGVLYSPDRVRIGDELWKAGSFSASSASPHLTNSGEIRYRNRFYDQYTTGASPERVAMGGWYYYVAGIGTAQKGEHLRGVPIAINFTARVTGTPSGFPDYVTTLGNTVGPVTATPSPSAAPSTDAVRETATDGVSPLLWVGGGLVGGLVIAGVAYVLTRRRPARRP